MFNIVKRIAGSAPIWAWITMVVCAALLVVGLIISSNRPAPTSVSAAEIATVNSASSAQQSAPTGFIEHG
ncbi:hypothetical protein [Gordonia rubripertincta]|uniref:hypothetical protein n=1 Tax=Gordonia rubripertincta TaxID=36822 RepID=UPI001EF95855|nr:hypothetical protein [Gordonia rubripertincta]